MKTLIVCLVLILLWAWFGEVFFDRANLNPLYAYDIDQRLTYYAIPVILGLLLRRKINKKE